MGNINQLAWDPSTQRLAVTFETAPEQTTNLIALFGVDMSQIPARLQPQ